MPRQEIQRLVGARYWGPGGLLGEAGDGVEVAVIVQDLKPVSAGGRRDEKTGD